MKPILEKSDLFDIKHQKLEDGRIRLDFYIDNKKTASIALFLTQDNLKEYICYIEEYLSYLFPPEFRTIHFRYKKERVSLELGINSSDRNAVEKPIMAFHIEYFNQKKKRYCITSVHGFRQDFLKTLYDAFLEIDPSVMNKNVESLLETNLFNYYDIVDGIVEQRPISDKSFDNRFQVVVKKVDVISTSTAVITLDDGCENEIVGVDRTFYKHKKRYQIGKKIILKLTPVVTELKNESLQSDDYSWSKFDKAKDFNCFPFYYFKAATTYIETDGHFDYGFMMNMIHSDNSLNKQIRLVTASIENPDKSELSDMGFASGKCYFEIDMEYAHWYHPFGGTNIVDN